jgi:hypothetical protein
VGILSAYLPKYLGLFDEKTPLNLQSQILVRHLQKSKKLRRLNIGMWGVYPEAMICNVGVLCSDINLGESKI